MSELNDTVDMTVSALGGLALDWAVCKAEGMLIHFEDVGDQILVTRANSYSIDWRRCGPLIDKYAIGFWGYDADSWQASSAPENFTYTGIGPTHLIAACRLIVAAKFGKVVSVPKELIS